MHITYNIMTFGILNFVKNLVLIELFTLRATLDTNLYNKQIHRNFFQKKFPEEAQSQVFYTVLNQPPEVFYKKRCS